MPSGKLSNKAAVGSFSPGPYIDSALKQRKRNQPPLSSAEVAELNQCLNASLARYCLHLQTGQDTPTERRRALMKLQLAARTFLERPIDVGEREKLANALLNLSRSTYDFLYREARAAGRKVGHDVDLVQLKKALADDEELSRLNLLAISFLEGVDIDELVPVRTKFRDPALVQLVADLVPIWKKATGRSECRISVQSSSTKSHPFAKWLMLLLKGLAYPTPYQRIRTAVGIYRRNPKSALDQAKGGAES